MVEIERKFLVDHDLFTKGDQILEIEQFYVALYPDVVVRIRRSDQSAYITIKGQMKGISRPEFEYPIPLADFFSLKKMTNRSGIEKLRHRIKVGRHIWDVDQFKGANEGLWLAEIELVSENETFEIPQWLGAEVTFDKRYFNSFLSMHPYSGWH